MLLRRFTVSAIGPGALTAGFCLGLIACDPEPHLVIDELASDAGLPGDTSSSGGGTSSTDSGTASTATSTSSATSSSGGGTSSSAASSSSGGRPSTSSSSSSSSSSGGPEPPCPSQRTRQPFRDVWEIFGPPQEQCRTCHWPGGHGPVDCFVAAERFQAHAALCRYRFQDDGAGVGPYESSRLFRAIFEGARYECPEFTTPHEEFYNADPDFDVVVRAWYNAATGQD
ncbi:MAG: hypothetical protein AB2A00_15725 [Myxococcota bacterium]